ncbi:MAG: sulfotransferase, partial [Candidatus Eremiobacteraeota bacterium]|nr:sulfotransferase [Candidatus Eremiobacteraeota bacterium]
SRYASKAIMCVIRMQYIQRIFPDARFFLYVRNPIDHVASLLKQDRIWDEIDQNDPRQIEIIELTGHHEFGKRQILANLGDAATVREIRELMSQGHTVRARARYWAYVYRFVLDQLAADPDLASAVCVVRYEDLCGNSLETIDRIVSHIELPTEPFAATRAAYAEKLSLPDYYRPNFDAAELGDIVDVTHGVASQFGYDVAALAQRAAAQPA